VHAIMIQGTGSDVGKSLVVAGLCRAFRDRGLKVRPFKPQNMSNNAAVTIDGGEIGRAQALQARACGVKPTIHMNPVLLKPETDTGAQVVVQGKRMATYSAREYGEHKADLLQAVLSSLEELGRDADLIIVEGAGSPAEINLRRGDIANMGFAAAADIPVALVGDINRGGVIANIVGTHAVLEPDERDRIKGFLINRFRGDVSLFSDGLVEIERRTGWPSLGVLPWFDQAEALPAEDILGLTGGRKPGAPFKISVPRINRIANFDDLDPLRLEPDVDLCVVEPGNAIPGDTDLILLPGSKATISDLEGLRREGWDIDIISHVRRGGRVIGVCGGYQMLGRTISDPEGIEGKPTAVDGLGLLDVETILTPEKTTTEIQGTHAKTGLSVSGYEIHIGETEGPDRQRPMFYLDEGTDGATSADGLVTGTYIHGVFSEDGYRSAFLRAYSARSSLAYSLRVDTALEGLGAHLAAHADLDRILAIAHGN